MWITLVIGVVKQIIGKQSQVISARRLYRIDESVSGSRRKQLWTQMTSLRP